MGKPFFNPTFHIADFKKEYQLLLRDLNGDGSYAYKNKYPYNLIEAIDPSYAEALPADFPATVEYVLLATLAPREEKILHLRFRDQKTYKEIGHEFNVTRERIRQIVAKTLRKLRHPSRFNMLRKGISAWRTDHGEERYKAGIELGYEKAVETIQRYKAGIDLGYEKVVETIQYTAEPKVQKIPADTKLGLNDSINMLELSVRSRNCLKRSGLNTIRDILALPDAYALCRIRNLGSRCCEEIISTLEKNGFDVSHLAPR